MADKETTTVEVACSNKMRDFLEWAIKHRNVNDVGLVDVRVLGAICYYVHVTGASVFSAAGGAIAGNIVARLKNARVEYESVYQIVISDEELMNLSVDLGKTIVKIGYDHAKDNTRNERDSIDTIANLMIKHNIAKDGKIVS